jgi:hypothetical protein
MRRLIALLAFAPALVFAQPSPSNPYQPPDEVRPVDERSLQLPPFPNDANLVKVQVDGGLNFDFLVDIESLGLGADGIVRYTLVARSSAGAVNIEYEGIRCKGRERRLYAVGRADKTWSVVRNSRWTSIGGLPAGRIQAILHDTYFCPGGRMVRDVAEAKKVLRRGGNPSSSDSSDFWIRNQ